MDDINTFHSSNTGIWYEHTYINKYPAHWEDRYTGGHAPEEFTKIAPMDWQLKPGKSASQAIQKWLNGFTIAECGSTLVAIHLDALRKQLGDSRFDECFGSARGSEPACQLLRVNTNHADCFPEKLLKPAGTDELGKAKLVLGAKYHFKNYDTYPYRHPTGACQGENCIYLGENPEKGAMWTGFGIPRLSTSEMFHWLQESYNAERTEEDYQAILLNETTQVEEDWVHSQHAKGVSFKALYDACKKKNYIHPYFIAAEQTLEFNAAPPTNGVIEIDGQGIMLNMQEIEKLRGSKTTSE